MERIKKNPSCFLQQTFFLFSFQLLKIVMNTYHNCIVCYLNYTGSDDQVH